MKTESGVEYTVAYNICPKCKNTLTGGLRRFGPAEVQCGRCNSILRTGLPEWKGLSGGRKVLLALSEILLPSWISLRSCTGLALNLVTQLFLWALVPAPLYVLLMILDPDIQSGFTRLGLFVFSFTYPLILTARLFRLIRESQAYSRSRTIPVWGTGEGARAGRYQSRKYQVFLRLLALLLTAAWFAAWVILAKGIIVLPSGGTTVAFPNNLLAGALLLAAHVGGAAVVAELTRCSGSQKRGAYGCALATILAAPAALLVAVFLRDKRGKEQLAVQG